MLFNTYTFLIFLPIVFILYWGVFSKKINIQNIFLLIASYFFYGWWSWKFLVLLFISTLLDYLYGFGVAHSNRKIAKFFLFFSLFNNLGILAIFKYYNFFILQFHEIFANIGVQFTPQLLNILLPVGISFYTFHGMSYIFDIYRGERQPTRNFTSYAVFVSFFPLLVSGPIERANHLLPQIETQRKFNYLQSVEGLRLILWGMFKKVIIADSLSPIVDNIFNNIPNHNAFALIIGSIGFSFQIYCDFSGYTDIALGTAKLFGFELLSNFKFPFFSRDLSEYWNRWHISLSSWFRDYVYYPLGGYSRGRYVSLRNMFIIFIISGFWHGASWNFIIWGFIHACGFIPILFFNKDRIIEEKIVSVNKKYPTFYDLIRILTTFIFATFAFIFFRLTNLNESILFINKIITDSFNNPSQYKIIPESSKIFIFIIPLILLDWYLRRDERKLKVPSNKYIRYFTYLVLTLLIYSFFGKSDTSFIYFQF